MKIRKKVRTTRREEMKIMIMTTKERSRRAGLIERKEQAEKGIGRNDKKRTCNRVQDH